MSDVTSGKLSLKLTPSGSATELDKEFNLPLESHTKNMRRLLVLAASLTDYPVQLPDFTTVSLIMMTTDQPFSYKLGATTNTARAVRQYMMETPNAEALATLYITTGTSPANIDLIVVGD